MQTAKCYGLSAVLAFGILLVVSMYINCIVLYYIGGILFIVPLFEPLVVKWKSKGKISPGGKAVFITGCDRGFGSMCAQRLDDLGYVVFAACLFPDGDGAVKLRKSGSSRLNIVPLDVTKDQSVKEAVTSVKENLGDNVLWAVINNAGIITITELQCTEMRHIEQVIDVNTMGVVRVSKAFLPLLKESKGRIVTITSLAARYSLPWLVPYCMSKSASTSFCDGLRMEMYKWGVKVISIDPAIFRTPMLGDMTQMTIKASGKNRDEEKNTSGSKSSPNGFEKILKLMAMLSGDPREVVSAVEEATTALNPRYYYSPGNVLYFSGIWILQKAPKPFSDFLIRTLIAFANRMPNTLL